MIVVLPYCKDDAVLAAKVMKICRKLDGKQQGVLVLSTDIGYSDPEVVAEAKEAFSAVVEIHTPVSHVRTWPKPQNCAFSHTARQVSGMGQPWIWLEPDAVPVKPGWIKTIEDAYVAGGKPFAGSIVHNHNHYMAGVGVYPQNVMMYLSAALSPGMATPWDVASGMYDGALPKTLNIGHLIKHVYDTSGKGKHFDTLEQVNDEVGDAVVYHRCSDGSLHDVLLDEPRNEEISLRDSSDVTVVITNYKRPELLACCIQSCIDAGVQNVVVSSSGANKRVKDVHKRFKTLIPRMVSKIRPDDAGCNECWIRGVNAAKTRMVTILHDDDILDPSYREIAFGNFDADFVHWDGLKHLLGKRLEDRYVTRPDITEGKHPAAFLLSHLLDNRTNTLSPVSGLFPRDHAIEVLLEAEDAFSGKEFHTRETMMVGNDLLLWLRACQKFKSVYYTHKPRISYGHWEGSESFHDAVSKEMKLLPIYTAARSYWLSTIGRIVHVVPRYIPGDNDTALRIANAQSSWEYAYRLGLVVPAHQWHSKRDSWSIGDRKRTPFLKDVLKYAICSSDKSDFVCLTNDDTVTNLFWWLSAYSAMNSMNAVCSFRFDVPTFSRKLVDVYNPNVAGLSSPGRDAFMFRSDWLSDNIDLIPDYSLGHGDWDSTLAMIIRMANGEKPKRGEMCIESDRSEIKRKTIFHVSHGARWILEGRESPGNSYNRKLTEDFFRSVIGWPMENVGNNWQ